MRPPKEWLLGLLLAAAVVLAYQPAWHAGFIWDDDFYVTQNPLLSAPDGLKRIWFSHDSPSQYFPLTYTTFRVERGLWGLNPAGYHWVNILLHAANGLLVWRLLKRLGAPGAWLGAALFALHPVQVESVAWITERKNLLMVFFFLLAVRAWVEFVEDRPRPQWRYYVLALLAGGLALCAKTTACTLPAALVLVLWLKKKPVSLSRWAQISPFVVMGAGMGILTVWWERYHQGTQGVFFAFSPLQRFLIASHAVWFYAGKLVWPVHLIFSYPRWTINPKHPLAYGWLAAGGVLCAVIYFARRWVGRSVEVAGLFYVATLSPLLGFIMIYTFRYTFVADHYQYAACIGPLALAAAGMEMGWGRLKRRGAFARPIFFAVLLTALGALTWRQCGMYADEETLWRATIARNPASWMAQDNLAMVLDQEGKLDEAMVHYQASLQIYPDHEEARNNLGTALDRKGKLDEAISQFQIALQINPNGAETRNNLGHALLQKGNVDEALAQYREAIRVKPDYAEAQLGLGNALRQKGSLDEAMVHYQEAARIKPDYAEAHNNLGAALDQKGKVDEAIAHYQSAVQINPGYAEAQMNLGSDLLQKGSLDEAMVHYLGALKSRPDYPEARNNLGNALLRKGRTDEAIAQFQIALRNHPGFAEAQFGLGNALRQMGRFDEAIARFQQALELKPSDAAIQNNLAWVLATCPEASLRNGAKAVELARQANALTGGKNPIILRTLAAALAEAGRFSEALEMAQQALRLAEAQSNSRLAGTLQTEIKLYQAALPFHDPAQKH